MNLSRFLPGFAKGDNAELTEKELDQLDAEAKADRIEFHRSQVRNGPRRPHDRPLERLFATSGRSASMQRRRAKAQVRKQNVVARRDWMRANRDLSRLRGQLEVIGNPELANTPLYENAMTGLFDGYGAVVAAELADGEGTVVLDRDSIKDRSLVVQAAAHHYKLATGQVAA